MKFIAPAILILLLSLAAAAQTSNRSLLTSMHTSLNSLCRGGRGDDQFTQDACAARTKVSELRRTIGNGKTKANDAKAKSIFASLNGMCRGYSGDLPETKTACEVRDKATSLMRNLKLKVQ